MNKSTRYTIAGAVILVAAGLAWWNWPVADKLEGERVAVNAPPADLVRFTATRSFTRLPLDEQMKYLLAWVALPEDVKSTTLAQLSKEPYVLDLSSANSQQTSQLHLARQYFAMPKEVRDQVMDQIIDQEEAAIKQVLASMKKADEKGGTYQPKLGDQKLRKLLIENTPAEVRVELAAFSQAKQERKQERGMKKG